MSSAIELRNWLNRPDHDFCANLAFGIKAWRSMEFVLITKHELITKHLCDQLPGLRKSLKKSDKSPDEAWSLVCEFLALKCPAGAISSAVKEQLVTVLRTEARRTLAEPHVRILEALLLTLHHTAMQNFYKSTPDTLADLIGTLCAYLRVLVERQPAEWLTTQSEAIAKLLAGVLTFVKQTPLLEEFRRRFAGEAYVQLVELVLTLRSKGHNCMSEFFVIVREMFFPAGSSTELRDFLTAQQQPSDDAALSEYAAMFAGPTHALALWLETILIAFKLDSDIQVALHQFLFRDTFAWDADSVEETADDLLPRVTYYLCILKRHDAKMKAQIAGAPVTAFLAKHVEALFKRHHKTQLAETLGLLCASLRLDPIMLEHSMITMAVQCMVQPKDAATTERFAEYLCLVLDVYQKLSRPVKFVSHLLRSLIECLAETQLSSKLKRKSLAVGGAASAKKSKGGAQAEDTEQAAGESAIGNLFFEMLRLEFSALDAVSAGCTTSAAASEWPDIAFAWPATVGNRFVQFLGGLVSKTSLVVWKTVLFPLTDYVSLLKEGHSDANTLFLVDICAALFCQYFAGARLAEHTAQTWPDIDSNRQLTHSLLHEFGKAILSKEHNNRTMNAFLKCCLHAGDFELLCFYYWPDTLAVREPLRQVHPYLLEPPQQWTLVEQRITNFGRDECKANINRILLQRMYGMALFNRGYDAVPLVSLDDLHQVRTVLGGSAATVLVEKLTPDEMRSVCSIVVGNDVPLTRISARVLRNPRFVFALYLHVYNQACTHFGGGSKGPGVVDCDELMAAVGTPAASEVVAKLVKQVREASSSGGRIKKANIEAIVAASKQLRQLPTDFLSVEQRNVLFLLKVSLYVGAVKTQDEPLTTAILSMLKAFVHFGQTPALFAVLPVDAWVAIFGGSSLVLPLWQTAFERVVRDLSASNAKTFEQLLALWQADDEALLDIALVLIEQLAKEKRYKSAYVEYGSALLASVRQHLSAEKRSDSVADAAYVARTLTGFVTVLSSRIGNAKATGDVDEALQRAVKVYLQHASIGGNCGASIRLLNLAYSSKAVVGMTDAELIGHVERYWRDYLVALRECPDRVDGYSELFLKSILNQKTNEEFIDMLDDGGTAGVELVENFCEIKHKLLARIAKCQLNKEKGSIFNEIFKQLSLRILLSLRLQGPLQQRTDAVLKLLECQKVICTNIQLSLSVEMVDDIIAFLSELNIKSIAAETTDTAAFVRLHRAMCEVCFALVQYRHFYVIDRVAQFGGLVRDLMHAVAFFKTPAKNTTGNDTTTVAVPAATTTLTVVTLGQDEVTMLADLSHRLENIVKSFVKHAKDVTRIAPYLLLSTINILVSDANPTTNNEKIKTHFDYICYDLISIFDHRVDGFVLRNCSEASKQVYEQLNRDFNRYHKFRGKV